MSVPLFQQLDNTRYQHHTKLYTDGSHSPTLPSTAAAVYLPATATCKTWRLPAVTDVLTAELFAILQALTLLHTTLRQHPRAVIYTDSLSSLHLILSRHPPTSTNIVHTIQQTLLHLTTQGWEIVLQWVPSHTNIRGNEIADSAAKMALTEVNITPLPLPYSTAKRLISRTCHTAWDTTLRDTLRLTTMGHYRSDSSPQPWIRQTSRVLDVALTRLRLGHTRLNAHLHRLNLAPDPYCPWCRGEEDTIQHYMIHCPRFHSHRVQLRSQLHTLNIHTFDLPTLLAATGVPPQQQPTVIRLTCAFLRKTRQLPRL